MRLTCTVSLFYLKKMEIKLKIAVQKSGRLHDSSMQLLKECGIKINNGGLAEGLLEDQSAYAGGPLFIARHRFEELLRKVWDRLRVVSKYIEKP